ncbi:unnamed protein product [Gemmataceae bacterium]|nr:unnamed protein product [Gemmataceae bacterium]VTT97491.1 unnamed protein product [Gemmataceae bacterium]
MTHSQDPHPADSNRHDTDANTLPRDQGRVPRGPGGGDERPIEPVGATGGGMGQRGQSGEHRNDACNDPGQHNTGVTGH